MTTPYDKLNKLLSTQFEIDLLEALITNLKDKSNKLRLNNFAYSIRELSRHFLHSLLLFLEWSGQQRTAKS